jgi:methylamine dehydrogenase light chain
MKSFDELGEGLMRTLARRNSRRSVLATLGGLLTGGALIPTLPVARASGPSAGSGYDGVAPQSTGNPMDPGDPASCDYWRYCGIDGFLCSCCGGGASACPPGTEMSPITWIGTCRNPGDGKDYVISYNDCCGASLCMRCRCTRTEGERPVYYTSKNNDLLWCFGTKSRAVHCSVAIVLGQATES